jgi:hypothetical protein
MRGAGLQSRWPRWPVTFTVVGVVIVGGSAAIVKWPHAAWWLIIATAVVAAVLPPALQVLSDASQCHGLSGFGP